MCVCVWGGGGEEVRGGKGGGEKWQRGREDRKRGKKFGGEESKVTRKRKTSTHGKAGTEQHIGTPTHKHRATFNVRSMCLKQFHLTSC